MKHHLSLLTGCTSGLFLLMACGKEPQTYPPESSAQSMPAAVVPAPSAAVSTAPPPAAADLSAQALGLCEAATKARAAGDVKAWERHVKDAFLIFDTKPLPKDTARRVLETALAYAEATPGEEGTAVALRFDLSTLDWSLEKRAAFRDLHYAEKQYLEINQSYEASESLIRRQRRLNEQGGGRSAAVSGIDPNLMMQRNAAFQLYKEAKQRFDALPGGAPPSKPGQK